MYAHNYSTNELEKRVGVEGYKQGYGESWFSHKASNLRKFIAGITSAAYLAFSTLSPNPAYAQENGKPTAGKSNENKKELTLKYPYCAPLPDIGIDGIDKNAPTIYIPPEYANKITLENALKIFADKFYKEEKDKIKFMEQAKEYLKGKYDLNAKFGGCIVPLGIEMLGYKESPQVYNPDKIIEEKSKEEEKQPTTPTKDYPQQPAQPEIKDKGKEGEGEKKSKLEEWCEESKEHKAVCVAGILLPVGIIMLLLTGQALSHHDSNNGGKSGNNNDPWD
ncbi:MAG: hypothetical protein N3D84_02605 [Candidatus Woesearchaeota archaeon]|nr:hypothetical protein [Candidatus Woesearchaeota archaeon]